MENNQKTWPALDYSTFQSTAHLLHMLLQVMGKYKLLTPFEPHWSNVSLLLTANGITTGIVPFEQGYFSIDLDLIDHQVICRSSWGKAAAVPVSSSSVVELTYQLFKALKSIGVYHHINLMPQEIPNPIAFDKDVALREYHEELANCWWRILLNSYHVMNQFHALFGGATPTVALMWGTMDLRDVRFINQRVPTTGLNSGYIRRNAMDVAQFEIGWWHGNEQYPKPAYYAFIYPGVEQMDKLSIQPQSACWDKTLGEFLLDYDDVRQAEHPEKELMQFFNSTYEQLSRKAEWQNDLIYPGVPI